MAKVKKSTICLGQTMVVFLGIDVSARLLRFTAVPDGQRIPAMPTLATIMRVRSAGVVVA
jgi:hypothetical protein